MINLDAQKISNGIICTIGTLHTLSGITLMKLGKISGLLTLMLKMHLELLMLCTIMDDQDLGIVGELQISLLLWEQLEHQLGTFNGLTLIQLNQDTLIIKVGGSPLAGIQKLLWRTDGSFIALQLTFGGNSS